MKKIALLTLLFIATISSSMAQRLIYGEKAPDIVVRSILMGDAIPKGMPIYLDFFSVKSADNDRQMLSLSNLARAYNKQIYFAIITNDNEEDVVKYFTEYGKTNDVNFSILLDSDGSSFKNFNIKFVPSSILMNKKGNFIWQGKSSDIDERTINQVIQ